MLNLFIASLFIWPQSGHIMHTVVEIILTTTIHLKMLARAINGTESHLNRAVGSCVTV